MEQIMNQLTGIVDKASDFVWNSVLLYVLVFTGILFTIRLGFIQVRKFGAGWRQMFGSFSLSGKKAGKDGMSSFQAAATSIAAQVGTGNIVGCCTALLSGGPGAIFWMWLAAFFGMATIYGEAVLAQKYKTRDDQGQIIGGPVYYIRARFQGGFGKFLAAFIFLGGVKRIASVTEKLVPVMAVCYFIGALIVILANVTAIPNAFRMIFVGAFTPEAVVGGAVGIGIQQAMRYGVARGLFSNEAGMGSTPHAHAMANVKRPEDQGHIAMVCVFIDTFVVLTLTALVVLTSGVFDVSDLAGVKANIGADALAQAAFSNVFGTFGSMFVAVCLLFFAFSTIVGWYFFGQQNVKYLFGSKAVVVYSIIVVICIVIGSALKVDLVWSLSDFFNGLMALPNLIALLALSGVVVKISRGEDEGSQLRK